MNKEISLALGGGGLKGLSHAGVIKRLIELGFEIKSIAGTSIGGLIGALYCAGYTPDEIISTASQFNQHSIYTFHNDGPGLLNLQSIAQLLINKLGDITFKDLKIKFACPAVDINSCQEYIFCNTHVVDGVLSTISVPGVFPPHSFANHEFVDGATINPVPVEVAKWLSPNLPVIAVPLSSPPDNNDYNPITPILNSMPIPVPLIEQFSKMRIARAFSIFSKSIDISSIYLTEFKLESDRPDVILRPDVARYGVFDPVDIMDMVQKGIDSVDQQIEKINNSLNLFSQLKRLNRKPVPPKRMI